MSSSAGANKLFDVSTGNPGRLCGLHSLKLVAPSGPARRGERRCKSSESTYYRLKARLLRELWRPGQLLQIGVLAMELGTSATPVREALGRLAAERLIEYRPKRGFLIKTLREEELRGLYLVNQMYLQTAVCCWQERAGVVSNSRCPSTTPLHPAQGDEASDLVDVTGERMLGIAEQSRVEEITAMVSNLNGRLHRARIAEQLVLDGRTASELRTLDALYAAADHEALKEAIGCYHEVRMQLARSICKELLSMAFADQ